MGFEAGVMVERVGFGRGSFVLHLRGVFDWIGQNYTSARGASGRDDEVTRCGIEIAVVAVTGRCRVRHGVESHVLFAGKRRGRLEIVPWLPDAARCSLLASSKRRLPTTSVVVS